ncbi:exo-alpha-sialidase [Phreatobacter sp.]|uniref:sialidase family protein n=1 Tax=Phreatobacter sp. TaxID=1966341 RepID=UPI0022BB37E8|nr:exo-alpha-sialidase [Phreatobacter sp.]MCZ8315760.1 exo-alpha-sialidase [Phreatobacter sp.]
MTSDTATLVLDGILKPRDGLAGQSEAFIPSPSPQNHAANLLTLADGSLACVWFGGTQEGMADISVHMARLEPGAARWSEAVKLADDATRSEQNPILFQAGPGDLWLLYTSQRSGNQDTAVVRRRRSRDDGWSWSAPETLIGDTGTFVRQPPLRRPDGAILLPTFLCRTVPGVRWVGDDDVSAVRISRDEGATWASVAVPGSLGCVHMSIVEAGNGEFLALYRSRWADFIHASRSTDGGATWSAPVPTELPNNNSSIQATRLADGRIALVYNHSSAANAAERRLSLYDEIEDEEDGATPPADHVPPARTAFWGAPRAPLMLAISSDGGRTWPDRRLIEDGDGYCMTNNSTDRRNRELSYPSVHQSPDGAIHVAFTYHRQAIKHVRLAPPA